jgi:hypothetical protein
LLIQKGTVTADGCCLVTTEKTAKTIITTMDDGFILLKTLGNYEITVSYTGFKSQSKKNVSTDSS